MLSACGLTLHKIPKHGRTALKLRWLHGHFWSQKKILLDKKSLRFHAFQVGLRYMIDGYNTQITLPDPFITGNILYLKAFF